MRNHHVDLANRSLQYARQVPADDVTNRDQWMYHLAVAQVEATLAIAAAIDRMNSTNDGETTP